MAQQRQQHRKSFLEIGRTRHQVFISSAKELLPTSKFLSTYVPCIQGIYDIPHLELCTLIFLRDSSPSWLASKSSGYIKNP